MKEPISEYRRKVDGRHYLVFDDDTQMPRAHYVWLKTYPNDPILDGEVIHHKNENKEDDSPDNLEKITAFKHRSLHSHNGINALGAWRKNNPSKAKKMSINNANKMHRILNADPIRLEEVKEKRRKAMKTQSYKEKQSRAQKLAWKRRKGEI
jgi:hypothetical protein